MIRASGKKLLEARIDQLRRIVTVQKLTHRTFTSSQWQELRAQLAAWKVCCLTITVASSSESCSAHEGDVQMTL